MSLLILGLGFAFFFAQHERHNELGSNKSLAIASATLATMRLIGQMMSMGIAMLMIAVIMGHVQIVPEYYPEMMTSVRVSFLVFTLLCFGGIFASLSRGKTKSA